MKVGQQFSMSSLRRRRLIGMMGLLEWGLKYELGEDSNNDGDAQESSSHGLRRGRAGLQRLANPGLSLERLKVSW